MFPTGAQMCLRIHTVISEQNGTRRIAPHLHVVVGIELHKWELESGTR